MIKILLHDLDLRSDHIVIPAVRAVQCYVVIMLPEGLDDDRYVFRAVSVDNATAILSETAVFGLSTAGKTLKQRSVAEVDRS